MVLPMSPSIISSSPLRRVGGDRGHDRAVGRGEPQIVRIAMPGEGDGDSRIGFEMRGSGDPSSYSFDGLSNAANTARPCSVSTSCVV
jgi:hypothetical protein